jgi:hypothetical protein
MMIDEGSIGLADLLLNEWMKDEHTYILPSYGYGKYV